MTRKAIVSVYNQTILSILDYAVFLLLLCNDSDRSDLQKKQNDIFRICYRVKLSDHISIKELHKKSKMVGFKQLISARYHMYEKLC